MAHALATPPPRRRLTPGVLAFALLALLAGSALFLGRPSREASARSRLRPSALAPPSSNEAAPIGPPAAEATDHAPRVLPSTRDVVPAQVSEVPLLVVTLVDGPTDDPAAPWDWTVDVVQVVAQGARWDLPRLRQGPRLRQALTEPRAAGVQFQPVRVVVELGPEVPRSTPLELLVRASRPEPTGGTTRFQGDAQVELTDAAQQQARVVCWRADPWAAGTVVAGTPSELAGARVELTEARPPSADSIAELERRLVARDLPGRPKLPDGPMEFDVLASEPVDAHGAFAIPPPRRAVAQEVRLRVVFADGRIHRHRSRTKAYDTGVTIDTRALITAVGRLLYRGAPAPTLATAYAEAGGMRVGAVTHGADGSFEVQSLPPGPFEVVIASARPTGVLARYPSSAFAASGSGATIELGDFELADIAAVLELTLRDPRGAPAPASFAWRGQSGRGRAGLAAQDVAHVLLMPPLVPYELELTPAPPLSGAALPLAAGAGARTLVLGD